MIYRLKVTTDSSKTFLRVYEVKGTQSLYTLHEHIQNDLGYAPDQMIEFRALNDKGVVKHEYGLFDMGDGSIDSICLDDLRDREETTFLYVFDMRNDRALRIEMIEEDEASSRKVYPLTIEDKGVAPAQFDAGQKEEAKPAKASRRAAPIDDDDDMDDFDDEDPDDDEDLDDEEEILDDEED